MTLGSDPLCAETLNTLRASVNTDGGWGYFPGKSSRLEPTCWAVLALQDAGDSAGDEARVDAALGLVASWQRAGGLLSDTPSAPANLAFNGLAALVIQRGLVAHRADRARYGPVVAMLLSAVVQVAGNRQGPSTNLRQNNQLLGWPWINGTFNWVEPTAWCLLALKKATRLPSKQDAAFRIAEADRMLADRCCVSGGWNYGNSNVLGRELFPYVPTTAVALLALQDRPALPEVARSVEWLAGNWHRERSALAFSLTLLAMHAHRMSSGDVERALRSHVAESGSPANLASAGLMLYALTGSRHEYAALEL
jgi:hypothetical protein